MWGDDSLDVQESARKCRQKERRNQCPSRIDLDFAALWLSVVIMMSRMVELTLFDFLKKKELYVVHARAGIVGIGSAANSNPTKWLLWHRTSAESG